MTYLSYFAGQRPMTLIEGVGDELLYAALFAVPFVIIFRSSLRYV
jgi:hypothetical protein